MIKLQDDRFIIGFDDGYQLSKTANYMFENGVHAMGVIEPTLVENSLFYEDNYYKVGEGRSLITEDKVSSENGRILAMTGIAKELRRIGITDANVVLAVGLPFSEYGRSKKSMIKYYSEKPYMEYEFEGVKYNVTIDKVFCFPQCYAAISGRIANMKGLYLIVDVGSKTTDCVIVQDGIPMESKSITIDKAMIKWIREIQISLKIKYGKEIPEDQILMTLLGENISLPLEMVKDIRNKMSELIKDLELELAELDYNLEYTRVIYVGGGASIIKRYSSYRNNVGFDTDISANAKGYEFLAQAMLQR